MYKIKRFSKSKDQGSKDKAQKRRYRMGLITGLSNAARNANEHMRMMDEFHN